MSVQYLQLQPDLTLPDISALKPFRVVVVIEEAVTPEWQSQVSTWLVASGCLYMMAWGVNCSSWDDSVDLANLAAFGYGDIPEDKFVMTTWHEGESLKDVYRFSKESAIHPAVEIDNILLLHISKSNIEKVFLAEYASA